MSKTLLLADDSVVIQKLVGLSFANEDVEIVSTDNGDDAVMRAREIRPDLVLADVVMPGKSGYEVCEAIKQDPALAHIPVLLLTGTFEAFDEARAQAVGATGHITKPFEAQALVERVKTVIKNAARPAPARTVAASPAALSSLVSSPLASPLAPPLADDLFDDGDRALPPTNRPSFFGTVESLDVTPSLGEEDLSDALDVDLFGPPGDVGGPTPRGGESFSSAIESLELPEAQRFADAPIEDATVALMADPSSDSRAGSLAGSMSESLAESMAMPMSRDDVVGMDLGFEDPIEVAPLPAASFDLDSAFDPAPPTASTALAFARDDANAATSRSLGRPGLVTDLDEMLASPAPTRLAPMPMPMPMPMPTAASTPTFSPAAARSDSPMENRPQAPTLLDLGPSERSGSDLDFGFDVSEQTTVSRVDLLEESFSSLLDVSESQILGESAPSLDRPQSPPAYSSPFATDAPPPPGAPSPIVEFDVSSSDLATAAPLFSDPEPRSSALLPHDRATATPSFDLEPPALDGPPPLPASAASTRAAAVAHMSPILQQQVQETLEKVAWEAFSDLSETIVKQVIERVERIAWEVIPQMAETLVREEIRKMKGEDD